MLIVRELKGDELLFTALTMLIGKEGVDYAFYEQDADWWDLRLYSRIN